MSKTTTMIRFEWAALVALALAAGACAEDVDPVDPPITLPDPAGSGRGSGSSTTTVTDAGGASGNRIDVQQSDGGWALPSPSSTSDGGGVPASGVLCASNELAEPNDAKVQPLAAITCGSIGGAGDAVDQYEAATPSAKKTIAFKATGDATLVLSAFGFSQSFKSGESVDIPSFGGMALKVRLTVQSPTNKQQSYRIDAP